MRVAMQGKHTSEYSAHAQMHAVNTSGAPHMQLFSAHRAECRARFTNMALNWRVRRPLRDISTRPSLSRPSLPRPLNDSPAEFINAA